MRSTLWVGCALAWAGSIVVMAGSGGSTDTTKPPIVGTGPIASVPAGATLAAPASWDGSYPVVHEAGGGLCPSGVGAFVVSGGKFSLPYNIGKLHVGRIEGTVQPDGTATATAVFAQPFPTELRRMMKRYYDKPLAAVPIPLADIHDVSVAFSHLDHKPQAAIAITSKKWGDFFACKLAWGVQPLKTYQTSGTLIGVKDGIITLQEGSDKWDYALDKDTKVTGELKPESRVTIVDRLSALSVELNDGAKASTIVGPAIDHGTGTVLGVSDDIITLRIGSEKWEYARGKDTKVAGELKAGMKVTILFRLTAVSVEAKPPLTAEERRAAAAEQREQEDQERRSREEDDRRSRESEERDQHITRCKENCESRQSRASSACDSTKGACQDKCDNNSQYDTNCSRTCGDELQDCVQASLRERDGCKSDCDNY